MKKTSMEFSDKKYPKGKLTKGKVFIGNMQLQPRDKETKFRFILEDNGRLIKEMKNG